MPSYSDTIPGTGARRFRFDAGHFDLSSLEILIMRVAFAALVFISIKWETGSIKDAESFFAAAGGSFIWKGVVIAGLAIYALGFLPALGLLPAMIFAIGIGRLHESQGAVNHSTQLVTLSVMGQFFVYALPYYFNAGLRRWNWIKPPLPVHQRAVYVTLVVIAACYVVSAWAKLDNSNWKWIGNVVPGLALELQKTNWSSYYDTLQPIPQALTTVVNLMNENPTLARLFFGIGLLLELFAFLALIGRRWAFGYGLALILLHLSISRLMQLDFWYHIIAILIFMVNIPGLARTFFRKNNLGLPPRA